MSQYSEARTGKVNAGAPPHVRAALSRWAPQVRRTHHPTFKQVHDRAGVNEAGGKANKRRGPQPGR